MFRRGEVASEEFQIIMRRLDQLESVITGRRVKPYEPPFEAEAVDPPPAITPEMTERERQKAIHAEARYILHTQGFEASCAFIREKFGRGRRKTHLKRVAGGS